MISVQKLIGELGYEDSPNFVTGNELARVPSYGHIFRRAQSRKEGEKSCGLRGVYTLRARPSDDLALGEGSLTPVVYVCEAESEAEADTIHRLVWNQDVVPFLIVRTPRNVRVYSGFGYREDESTNKQSAPQILRETIEAQEIASKLLESFSAEHIDDGTLWRDRGKFVTPKLRVDWRLLARLEVLGGDLRKDMNLPAKAAHALIGKYVYLRYLRDRDILSDKRFAEFRIDPDAVFTGKAQLTALRSLIDRLDEWINGSVFDIPWSEGVKAEHIKRVAGTFFGDDPRSGQGSLFEDYNFSYIPIETLSVVYEQFLHAEKRGKDAGAYYTPIPLVNFMLDEMEASLPFTQGMRVLDPACGSGAFLVQCYRRLIEKELLRRKGQKFRPVELREMLRNHIFGIDRDEDACQVTELSLILTLLDYVDPPDLSTMPQFKLPKLRGSNIFGGPANDFFKTGSEFHQKMGETKFHWLVGNPPWVEINEEKPRPEDKPARDWMNTNVKKYPTGGNQVAELFAWKATEHIDDESSVGLLMPAMTLFKDESTAFRQAFFARVKVSTVVNFANLAYVLFAGRSEVPAAAIFYQKRPEGSDAIDHGERILTFAPLVANQEANRPVRSRRNVDTWTITINGSELREVGIAEAIRGDALTWKLAIWGSYRDQRLLETVSRSFPSVENEEATRQLLILQGLELRDEADKDEKLPAPYLIGKNELVTDTFRRFGRTMSFPQGSLREVSASRAYIRVRSGLAPLEICEPPHVIVPESRNFAIFSDKFLVVPPKWVGVRGPKEQTNFLKLLCLYLNSHFAMYFEALRSPRWGVSVSVSTIKALKALPVPLGKLTPADADNWLDLYARLVAASPMEPPKKARRGGAQALSKQKSFPEVADVPSEFPALLQELNDRVYKLLRLSKSERILVEDFVRCKRFAVKGKVREETVGVPGPKELEKYATVLQAELDGFFEDNPRRRHRVEILYDETSRTGMIDVGLVKNSRTPLGVKVRPVDDATAVDFQRARQLARQRRGQWLYFQRSLRIYEGPRTLLLKPLERLHWLRSQALLDADTIIAETLAGGEK